MKPVSMFLILQFVRFRTFVVQSQRVKTMVDWSVLGLKCTQDT